MILLAMDRQTLDDAYLYGQLWLCDYEELVRSL